MFTRFWPRGSGPSLRARLEAAQIGVVDAPELEDDEPAAAAPAPPRSALAPPIVIGDGSWQPPAPAGDYVLQPVQPYTSDANHVAALIARVAKAEDERDAIAAELQRTQTLLTEEIEHARAAAAPAPTGGPREVVDTLRESNQRLRTRLRSETDRANRAEARVAGLELTCQSLARAYTGCEKPEVVVVDDVEMVVPWPRRA